MVRVLIIVDKPSATIRKPVRNSLAIFQAASVLQGQVSPCKGTDLLGKMSAPGVIGPHYACPGRRAPTTNVSASK